MQYAVFRNVDRIAPAIAAVSIVIVIVVVVVITNSKLPDPQRTPRPRPIENCTRRVGRLHRPLHR
ncbi:MAG: hypothetical protein QOH70_1462 [Blastocatellia bacterium]|nr:hypothetical protein [Blastocatellia bacterium]